MYFCSLNLHDYRSQTAVYILYCILCTLNYLRPHAFLQLSPILQKPLHLYLK